MRGEDSWQLQASACTNGVATVEPRVSAGELLRTLTGKQVQGTRSVLVRFCVNMKQARLLWEEGILILPSFSRLVVDM